MGPTEMLSTNSYLLLVVRIRSEKVVNERNCLSYARILHVIYMHCLYIYLSLFVPREVTLQ